MGGFMDSNPIPVPDPAPVPNPAPVSMRATWPGTDVIIELNQYENGDVSASFPQAGYLNETLYAEHDAEIIRRLGFYVPDLSVPAKECGEMTPCE